MSMSSRRLCLLIFVVCLVTTWPSSCHAVEQQQQQEKEQEVSVGMDGSTTQVVAGVVQDPNVSNNADADADAEPPCQDTNDQCALWKDAGECTKNAAYMHLHCKQSCGICDCVDLDEKCPHLAYRNQCVGKDETWMFLYCKKSCQACGILDNSPEMEALKVQRRKLASVGGDARLLETKYGYQQIDAVAGYENQIRQIVKETEDYMEQKVYVEDKYKNVVKTCMNRHDSCAYWKATGVCESNVVYMRQKCAPTCQICEQLDFLHWCPLDDTKPKAFTNAGDLDKVFERIMSEPEFQKYSPKARSMPNPPKDSTIPSGPWIIEFDTFVPPDECDQLIEHGTKVGYTPSVDTGVKRPDGTVESVTSTWRTSATAWCQDKACLEMTQDLHDRVEHLTTIPMVNAENLQLLYYQTGEYYKYHHDATPIHWERQMGPRVMTMFFYLNNVTLGGGTNFPDINITVTPQQGKAVLWPNVLNEDPMTMDRRTAHQALPVEEGIKYGANLWIHQRNFKEVNARRCA